MVARFKILIRLIRRLGGQKYFCPPPVCLDQPNSRLRLSGATKVSRYPKDGYSAPLPPRWLSWQDLSRCHWGISGSWWAGSPTSAHNVASSSVVPLVKHYAKSADRAHNSRVSSRVTAGVQMRIHQSPNLDREMESGSLNPRSRMGALMKSLQNFSVFYFIPEYSKSEVFLTNIDFWCLYHRQNVAKLGENTTMWMAPLSHIWAIPPSLPPW